jgi:anti-anti-sigma factor
MDHDGHVIVRQNMAGEVVIALVGDFDLANAGYVRACIDALDPDDAAGVVFDLTDAGFIDSSTIAVFAAALRRGFHPRAIGANGVVRRALDVTGLLGVLEGGNGNGTG